MYYNYSSMNLYQLKDELEKYDIKVDEETLKKLDFYACFLKEYNQKVNLTAIDDYEEILSKHFLDSVLAFRNLDFKDGDKFADVGSGAGFPGMVLKIIFPNLKVYLIEPTKKRCVFLSALVEKLDLKEVFIINDRAENLIAYRHFFDFVSARAVSSLNVLLELCIPLLKVGGIFVALKGKDGLKEISEAKNAIEILKLEQIEILFDTYEENKRVNVYYRLKEKIAKKYPRNYSIIKKKPL